MPWLFKHMECRACGHWHHFFCPRDDVALGAEYTYVCPVTGRRASLRTGPEAVTHGPEGAVALEPAGALEASQPPAPADPEAGPVRLEEVLPQVKGLAEKVGGLGKLADLVETLKGLRE